MRIIDQPPFRILQIVHAVAYVDIPRTVQIAVTFSIIFRIILTHIRQRPTATTMSLQLKGKEK